MKEEIVYDRAKGRICPIRGHICAEYRCAWWCRFAADCSVPLLTGMFAETKVKDGYWTAAKAWTPPTDEDYIDYLTEDNKDADTN